MSRKLAYVHYPHGPKSSRLETMPFSSNTVVELASTSSYLYKKMIPLRQDLKIKFKR